MGRCSCKGITQRCTELCDCKGQCKWTQTYEQTNSVDPVQEEEDEDQQDEDQQDEYEDKDEVEVDCYEMDEDLLFYGFDGLLEDEI